MPKTKTTDHAMTVSDYQKKCFAEYKSKIGYPEDYRYLHGTHINVLVPIETTQNKVMIIGAYPSAKFFTIDGIPDTPVADNDSPFSNESYFDGSRVRTIPSGKELNEVILNRIGVKRSDCWITDLIKVFLFKDGHINRYKKLGKFDLSENRSKFKEFADKSLIWIDEEIEICNPSVIILLGVEVTEVFLNITKKNAIECLDGTLRKKKIGDVDRNIICLPHPGILMKRFDRNPWPKNFEEVISVNARNEIEKIKKDWE